MTTEGTGPAYPPPPGAGSNAIGRFEIGASPIGDISLFDFWKTIASQYANSPRLITLIESFVDSIDKTRAFNEFFDLIWNVQTAQGYGLDVWGRIVGINRVLSIQTGSWFGFKEPGDAEGFNVAAFWNGKMATTNFRLSDQEYRRLILAKAMANICDGSIPQINAILRFLFPNRGGNAYVAEGAISEWFGFTEQRNTFGFNQAALYSGQTIPHMVIEYTFGFQLTLLDFAIIQSGVLPKPVGVKASVVILA